ncbi:ABC transporter ATP-binding protein [Acinetobacter oleivorans]|uniref:ATP-binding cassette domain-containing protein n=1 Tax=Acinetobacter oleivorans TaxID=1148157 RepID=UPI00178CDE1C|nr:ABC transporter ATP-binding protein [Acinetobacter oleivorans]MBE2172127.1 ABC transporter ATP-binding protein [Acinetobacter oleivorans]MDY7373592.1 ABC transporter ATP-binding protein [Acinetobacter oleivorans]
MKRKMKIFLFYLNLVGQKYTKIYIHALILLFITILVSALTTFLPYLMKLIVDSSNNILITNLVDKNNLILLLAISFSTAWIALKILTWSSNIFSAYFMVNIEANIIFSSFSNFINSKMDFVNRIDIGILNSDVQRASLAFGQIIYTIFLVILPVIIQFLLVISVISVKINFSFTVFFSVATIVIFLLTLMLISKSGSYFNEIYEADNEQSKFFLEKVNSVYNIKSQGAGNFEILKFRKICENYISRVFYGNLKIGMLMIYQVAAVGLFLTGSMIYAVYMFNNNQFTAGDFVLISSYIIELSAPLVLVSQNLMQTNGHFISIEKLEKYFNSPKEIILEKNYQLENLYYKFDDVSYSVNGVGILKNFSFEIPKGAFLVIKGETGSGKSSFINLLLGINKIDSGKLFFGDLDISNSFSSKIHDTISFVPQKSFIFSGTVRENILYNNNLSYSDEELIIVLKEFNLYKILVNNNISLDSSIDELFKFFSGGEVQRFNLVRAILAKPEVLILDEPTSALDSVMAKKVFDIIKNNVSTLIVISHSDSLIKLADRQLHFPLVQSKDLVESGS